MQLRLSTGSQTKPLGSQQERHNQTSKISIQLLYRILHKSFYTVSHTVSFVVVVFQIHSPWSSLSPCGKSSACFNCLLGAC